MGRVLVRTESSCWHAKLCPLTKNISWCTINIPAGSGKVTATGNKIHRVNYLTLITCVIVRSNSRILFSFHAGSNAGHYQSIMTSHNGPRMWYHEHKVRFLSKCISACATPSTHAFVTLHDGRQVWIDHNSLKGIDRHWVKRSLVKYFFINYTKNAFKMSKLQLLILMTIITLHHFYFGHCVNSSVIVLDLGIFLPEFTQWPQKRWCAVIIV